MKIITTSWDDGHPLDFKLAALLDKYNIKGTFYIPKSNQEHKVMSEAEIKMLAQHFEIGGHTLTHARLGGLGKERVYEEIDGCYRWLTAILDKLPVSFCFPGGVYDTVSIKQATDSGFKVLRTTELLSIKTTVAEALTPTTLQLYEHSRSTYLKHLLKRRKVNNFLHWLQSLASSNLLKLVDYYLHKLDREGGCLHLWGHSWEIEQYGLWQKLELVLKQLCNLSDFDYRSNQNLLINEVRASN
ncbi:polysaccharide deacetylase family protein [Flavisolibacter sp. BT320]|nr:polysaccharide deacetylase family protein [Flavisolibacter longurius]